MKVAITGATGYIGTGLVDLLYNNGHEVIALTRDPERAILILGKKAAAKLWQHESIRSLASDLEGTDVLVNLAGENIGSSLWTKAKRAKITGSRIKAGNLITELIRSLKTPPRILIQASAVGYYGSRADEILTEASNPGEGFLPDVCTKWEQSTSGVEELGVRRILIRTGVVLSRKGGALPKIALPYRLHLGTILGSGKQWLPWIHYEDQIDAIHFLIKSEKSTGIYNLVAPGPERIEELCKLLGPTLIRLPHSFVEVLLGQMGRETVLASQRVVPERLLGESFAFEFTEIDEALRSLG